MLPDSKEVVMPATAVISKILRLLDPLKRSESGTIVFAYIEQTLTTMAAGYREVEHTYGDLLALLLDHLARQLPNGSPLQVQLKLLEVRLTPPSTGGDLADLRAFLKDHGDDLARGAREGGDVIEAAIAPLLESFNIGDKVAPPPAELAMAPAAAPPTDTADEPAARPRSTAQDRRVDVSYRRHLDEKRQGIQRIQQTLGQQVSVCIKNNANFHELLEKNLQLLQQLDAADNTVRNELIAGVEKLLAEQRDISQKLEEAKAFLGVIESDSQQLSDELTRIHLLSLTDDLTGLPNRRAFLRRLQDEASRVQRYGIPLTMALIDLDGFKSVNAKLGHAAGDEVLRVVASEILSIFRHHDLVARYGGEEFGVLLPNTHVEGAMRALRKVQTRAQEVKFQHEGVSLALPAFSAGLTLYRPGESHEAFMQRADHALYRAKRMGRNHIESDQVEISGVPSSMA